MARVIRIATSQFPVSASVQKNLGYIQKHIEEAALNKAQIVHFSECCLSGYGEFDFKSYTSEQNTQIIQGITEIQHLAKHHHIWVIFGTHFFECDQKKPFNSLFLITSEGAIQCRYDKRLLAEFDLNWYSAGSEPGIVDFKGIKCALIICHEWRYPELYRQYYHEGVELLFQSWYDGNYTEEEYQSEGKNLGEVIPGFVRGNAANNKLWISAANTSKKQSSFAAFVCRPDGSISRKLKRNRTGILISEINADKKYLDLSAHLRDKVSRMNY